MGHMDDRLEWNEMLFHSRVANVILASFLLLGMAGLPMGISTSSGDRGPEPPSDGGP
jgi:hypothetical protein